MNILICIAKVPDTTTKISFTDNNTKFNKDRVQWVINPLDEFALTRAIEIKEAMGGKITVINVGLADTEPLIRKAFAIGADEGIRVNAEPTDCFFVGKQIAHYAKEGEYDFVFAGTTTDILLKICLMILIAFFLKNLFGYLQNFFLIHVEQGLIRDIRNVVFKHIHKLPMSFFKKEKTGDLISRLNHDVYVIQTSAGAIFLSLFREPISILVFFGIAFSISWKLTLFSIAIVDGFQYTHMSHMLQENTGRYNI